MWSFSQSLSLCKDFYFHPILIALLSTEALFDFVGFDKEAFYYSQIYINRMIPGLYLGGLVDSNRRLLNSIG